MFAPLKVKFMLPERYQLSASKPLMCTSAEITLRYLSTAVIPCRIRLRKASLMDSGFVTNDSEHPASTHSISNSLNRTKRRPQLGCNKDQSPALLSRRSKSLTQGDTSQRRSGANMRPVRSDPRTSLNCLRPRSLLRCIDLDPSYPDSSINGRPRQNR